MKALCQNRQSLSKNILLQEENALVMIYCFGNSFLLLKKIDYILSSTWLSTNPHDLLAAFQQILIKFS